MKTVAHWQWGRSRLPAAIVCGVMLAFSGTVNAGLDPRKAITQYRHDVWRVEEGLPQNTVPALAQTPDGYLWLGTELGLVRFDGERFTVYDKANTPQLNSNTISALYADRGGKLWIGTAGGGLTRLDHGTFVTYTARDGLANDYILSILEDSAGSLWVGTNGGGLSAFRDGRFTTYGKKQGLPGDAVFAMAEDREGSLWIGTHDGLSRLKNGKLTTLSQGDSLPAVYVRALYADRDGTVWVGTNGGGLSRFKDGQFKAFSKKDGLCSEAISSIVQDDSGTLWLGTIGGGVCRWAAGRFTAYTVKDGLSNDDVWTVYFDRTGNLWIGTGGGGLNRLANGRFTAYTTREGLSNDAVLPIFEDHAGRIWIGTNGGGVNRIEHGRVTAITTKNGLADNLVFTIAEDRSGAMWFGTRRGINRFKDGSFTVYTTRHGLPSDIALATFLDSRGRMWIGTRAGVSMFDRGKFTNFTTANGLTSDCVQAIEEDSAGTLWFGTCGGGVNRFQEGRFEAFDTARGLASNVVMSLHADSHGALWIGTNGGGLSRLKGGKFTTYTTREGLTDDAIFRILEDGAGNLWMSSNKGVFRCSMRELNRLAEGHSDRISPVSYDRADGMKSKECNGGFQPAGWRTRDGKLWFPTMSGAVTVDPNESVPSEPPPPVVIERARINKRISDPAKIVEAAPGMGELEFRYTGISFEAPEKTAFRYRLEGFDRDWIDAGPRREAYYTNIPSGNYRFRVIAAGKNGSWNQAGASMEFILLPHWWEMWWFRAAAASVAVGLVVLIIWWKDRLASAHRRRLEAMVTQRTSELYEQVRKEERARAELAEAQQRLIELSRLCGMAEVATGVLHNVGNVLNSVNVGTTIVSDKVRELRVDNLAAVIEMLQQHSLDLGTFVLSDPRGQRVIPYLAKLGKNFQNDRKAALAELKQLQDHIEHIKAIVATQQKYARVSGLIENLALADVVEDALRVVAAEFDQHQICTEREFEELPQIAADRHKIIQILLNLLRNAKDAVVQSGREPRTVQVKLRAHNGDRVRIEVTDSGIGLQQENLTRIFASGFTTKEHGHGFGLHSGALAARQMSGALWAESEGPGLGATFILELPAASCHERSAA